MRNAKRGKLGLTHHAGYHLRIVLTMMVAFFVALRVIAQPLILAAPHPGVMAICAGGQIVYVSLDTGLPVETETGIAADPCPLFGVTALTDVAAPPITAPHELSELLRGQDHAAQTVVLRMMRFDTPRAPPLFT